MTTSNIHPQRPTAPAQQADLGLPATIGCGRVYLTAAGGCTSGHAAGQPPYIRLSMGSQHAHKRAAFVDRQSFSSPFECLNVTERMFSVHLSTEGATFRPPYLPARDMTERIAERTFCSLTMVGSGQLFPSELQGDPVVCSCGRSCPPPSESSACSRRAGAGRHDVHGGEVAVLCISRAIIGGTAGRQSERSERQVGLHGDSPSLIIVR
jgi:hypothetical protein